MQLCALIYRGQLVEVSVVPEDHDFGEHGNHFHLKCRLAKRHLCADKPLIQFKDEGPAAGG